MPKLIIIEKNTATPLEISAVTRRLSSPIVIQPDYQFDPSDMYSFFIPEVSFGNTFYWDKTTNLIEVSTGFAEGVFVKESSLGTDFVWIGGMLDVSIVTMDYAYVDGSLAARDTAISNLRTYVDGSLLKRDVSISWLNTNKAGINYVDGSLASFIRSASCGITTLYFHDNGILDVSDYVSKTYVDVSLIDIKRKYLLESSIGSRDFYWRSDIDNTLDVSTIDLDTYFYSKYYIDQWLTDISSGRILSYFTTNASMYDYVDNMISGLISDTSLLAYQASYIDPSIFQRDVSIAWLNTNKVSMTFFDSSISALIVENNRQDSSISYLYVNKTDKTYVDSSLNLKLNISDASTIYLKINDASNNYLKKAAGFTYISSEYVVSASDNFGIIEASGTFDITFPNSLFTGFQTTIVNIGTGTITLEASTLLTKDSSVRLIGQYSAVSSVHKGNGVWYAFGNLQ